MKSCDFHFDEMEDMEVHLSLKISDVIIDPANILVLDGLIFSTCCAAINVHVTYEIHCVIGRQYVAVTHLFLSYQMTIC